MWGAIILGGQLSGGLLSCSLKIYIRIISIIPISIQVLIPDLIFPIYKIDREQSAKMFLRNVWRYQRGIQKSKELNILHEERPTLQCISYHSVMKLPGSEPDFFLSKITGPWWLELPIARTDFDSTFEFESTVYIFHFLLCIKPTEENKIDRNVYLQINKYVFYFNKGHQAI